jgi:ABC-type antimicrobial peptide transport system permease subunit
VTDTYVHPSVDRLALPIIAFVLAISGLYADCMRECGSVLARASSRSEELAVRRALGATQADLTFHVLTENIILAAVSASRHAC